MSQPQYQYLSVELFSLKPSSQKKAQTVKDNKDEDWDRKPYASPHVPVRKQPNAKDGDADAMLKLVRRGAARMRDRLGRRQRRDCPVVMSVVTSWPTKVSEMTPADWKKWRAYANRAYRWIRSRLGKLGATFGYAVEHLDESHPHMHVHFHRHGASIKPCHPGHRAGKAYKAAMSQLQDDFNHEVAAEFGLLRRSSQPRKRIHPRAHRAGVRILKSQRPPDGWKKAKTAASKKRRQKRGSTQPDTKAVKLSLKPRPSPDEQTQKTTAPTPPENAAAPSPAEGTDQVDDLELLARLRRKRRPRP